MAKKPKFTRAQIKTHIKNVQAAMEEQRREHEQKGEQFVSITPEEIEKKLKRVNSPIIVGEGWTPKTTPGGTGSFSIMLYNPDPTPTFDLYAHVWVGSGNVDPILGTFLLNVDTRFPRLTQPTGFGGLVLAPGKWGTLLFSFQVPTTIERSGYFMQCCLMHVNWLGLGKYLDRAMVVFEVA